MKLTKKIKKFIKITAAQLITKIQLFFLLKVNGVTKKDWIFLLPFGLGDTLFLSSLIREFKLKNGGKVVILVKKNHQILVQMFPAVDQSIILKSAFPNFCYKKICNTSLIKKGRIFIPHPLLNSNLSSLVAILGYKNLSLVDMYKIALKLDESANLETPDFNIYNISKAKDFLNKMGFDPAKTVIIMPEATSIPMISVDLWNEIISKLRYHNFYIIINSANKNNFHTDEKKVISLDVELKEIVAISRISASTISLRSGICDLLAFSNANLVVLYPDLQSQKTYSLNNIFKDENFSEIIIDKFSNQEELTDKIINQIQRNVKLF